MTVSQHLNILKDKNSTKFKKEEAIRYLRNKKESLSKEQFTSLKKSKVGSIIFSSQDYIFNEGMRTLDYGKVAESFKEE